VFVGLDCASSSCFSVFFEVRGSKDSSFIVFLGLGCAKSSCFIVFLLGLGLQLVEFYRSLGARLCKKLGFCCVFWAWLCKELVFNRVF
jgi:hypothetical protein